MVLLCLAVPATAHAAPFTVGTGQNGGIAIDDGGTVFVGWQINTYEPGDAVQFCVVPPRRTVCAFQTTIAFPGEGYNRSRVSVLLPAPNVVDVIVPRTITSQGAFSFLARSVDGGRTFAPAVQISGEQFAEGRPRPRRPDRARGRPHDHARRPVRARRIERRHRGQLARALPRGRVHRHRRLGRGGTRGGLGRRHVPRLPARRRRGSQQRCRVAADRSRAGQPPAVGRGSARRLRGHARAHGPRQPVRPASRGRRVVAARRPRRRRQQQRLPAHRQRQGPPDGADHLHGLPPRLHDVDGWWPAVVLHGDRREPRRRLSHLAGGRHQRFRRGRRRGRLRARRQVGQGHALHAAYRARRTPHLPRRRARADPQQLRRRQALGAGRGRPRHRAASRRRRSCAAPASAAPAAPAAASGPASAPATSCAGARARIPVRVTPRRGKARTLRLRVRRCGATR